MRNILYPVPHRQYVFSLPIILRAYFKHRKLLTKLCHCAYESLLEFLHTTIGLSDGVPGVVLTIHTFGDYMEKFHPHLHAFVSNGFFRKSGTFYVMPKVDLGPLEEIFRAKVLKMLKAKDKIGDALINNLMNWKHTGFKNFLVYQAEDFIAAICQHIPKKFSQMVRYFGYYSNKSRGMRRKEGILRPGDGPLPEVPPDVDIIDVSEYNPPHVPSKTWRECIIIPHYKLFLYQLFNQIYTIEWYIYSFPILLKI